MIINKITTNAYFKKQFKDNTANAGRCRKYKTLLHQCFNFLSILEVFGPLNEGLSSAISEFEKHINYILIKVQSRSSLAKILNMSSEIAFPNLTFYTQRIKNPVYSKDFNGIVIMTLSNSPISEEIKVRLAFTSWV